MELKHIEGIGPAKQKKLSAAGIDSVETLARADVAAVAKATGMSETNIKDYKQRAVALTLLEDVKGIGPQTVIALAQAGVQSVKDLAEASAEWIAAEAKVAKAKASEWKVEAEKLASHIAEESKTPEGRKKLVDETAAVAKKTASKTKDVAMDLYALAKKESEAAIAKAKDLKEKAPDAVREARAKAEAALKEAEARMKALQGKAPQAAKDAGAKAQKALDDLQAATKDLAQKIEAAAKTEVQKVKAANEGFFARLKQKFQKA